jgi:type II secretory pathway pseudopilin PulG
MNRETPPKKGAGASAAQPSSILRPLLHLLPPAWRNWPRRPDGRGGFALIVILFAVSLVAVLIVIFLVNAIFSRRISFSDTSQTKAEMLCRSAADLVVGEVRDEIRLGSKDTTGSTSFAPSSPGNIVPQKEGVASPDTTGGATLLKVSASGKVIDPFAGGGRVFGSSISTSVPSLNGRSLSSVNWFGTNGPQLGSQPTLPTWAYISRGNSVVPAPTSSAVTDPNYVIGRFAYTVYDIGGLLNANVAGYPSADSAVAPFKSNVA